MQVALPTAGDRGLAERLAQGLRQVVQRSVGLPEPGRRRAVELYLAYHLRGESRQRAREALQQTLARLAPVAGAPAAGGGVPGPTAPPADSPEEAAQGRLSAVTAKLRTLAGDAADPGLEPEALVGQVQARTEAVGRAVEQTAQEFFDRLLQALDPATARAFVGKPGLRPAPLYKAAVFDAYAEKFEQLAEYHRKGRLVRDFRASFKRNLRG